MQPRKENVDLDCITSSRMTALRLLYIKHNTHYTCSFDFLQLYKQNVLGEVREFIPLIIKTIVLQPSMQARSVLVESTFKLICIS